MPSALVSLIKHFTTSSWNLCVRCSSLATVTGGVASRRSSTLNEFILWQCSSTFSIKTFNALTNAGPSSISGARGSKRRVRRVPMQVCSAFCPTAFARAGHCITCISAFRTYRHARAVLGPGAAAAASKMGATRGANCLTKVSTSGAIAVSITSSPTAPITSWHSCFMPSTATASVPVATVASALRQPCNRTSIISSSSSLHSTGCSSSQLSPARSCRSLRAREDTALPMGLSNADATAAIGEPTAVAVAASLPGVATDRETDFPASAEGRGTAPTAAALPAPPPTMTPPLDHAPGVPSFFFAISFAAFANLSSRASLTSGPTRPMCFHAPSPATLYEVVRQVSAAARVGASLASASFAISCSALEPPRSTTSKPCLSTSSSRASNASILVFVFLDPKPRTKYPARRDAGNNPGTNLKTARNFSRTASMACPDLSTSAGRNKAPSCSVNLAPLSFTTRNTCCVKSRTFNRLCVLGVCSMNLSTTQRRSKSRLPNTLSRSSCKLFSKISIATRCALKS